MPQIEPAARPVAGGEILVTPGGGSPVTPGPLPYEMWLGPDAAWVELTPTGTEAPVLLDGSTVGALKLVLDHNTPAARVESASVGVQDGDVAVAFRQEWPLGTTLLFAISVLAVGLAVGVAVRSRRQADRLRALARREAESREAERTRVAREIHDGALQDLALLARSEAPVDVRDRIRDVGADLRALAADLRPPALDRLGLPAALEDLADRWARAPDPLTVRVRVDDDRPRPAAADELALFRVAQEALSNASRHGRARTAWVFLRAAELVVRDDGKGLPDDVGLGPLGERRLLASGHYGLAGMAERARAAGGALRVARGPGGVGTEVRVRVPHSA